MLHTILMVIHFFCAAAIISLVLLQRGKGAEAGAGFGAGASGTVFGARGASTALSRATAILAGIFMLTSLSLAYVNEKKPAASSSLLDQLQQQSTAPNPVSRVPGGATPVAPGGSAAPSAPSSNAPPPAAPAAPASPVIPPTSGAPK